MNGDTQHGIEGLRNSLTELSRKFMTCVSPEVARVKKPDCACTTERLKMC